MALNLDLAPGDTVTVGQTRVTFVEKSGKRGRLRIDSPDDVHVTRAGAPLPALTRSPATPEPDAAATTPRGFVRAPIK